MSNKAMSKEKYDALCECMGVVTVFVTYSDLIGQDIKESLTFSKWEDIFLRSGMNGTDPAIRFEAFSWMIKLAQTAQEWAIVYGHSKEGSHEETLSQERLCSEEFDSLLEWGTIHNTTISGTAGGSHKKIRAFAEKRMRVILEK